MSGEFNAEELAAIAARRDDLEFVTLEQGELYHPIGDKLVVTAAGYTVRGGHPEVSKEFTETEFSAALQCYINMLNGEYDE